MKSKLLFLFLLFSVITYSQIPKSFKYQAVVRDANGIIFVNRLVSIKTSILSGSTSGTPVYVETQTLSTNDYGVVSLNIGSGTVVSGNFSTINWGVTTFFVKTELDINGASTYVFMGTSQLLSVPFAIYAETSERSKICISDGDTSGSNELQRISLVGDSLSISDGNTIFLSGKVDLDQSPTNEIQNISLVKDTIKISQGNYLILPKNNDNDSSNELQTLNLKNDTLSLSKSNQIIFNHDSDLSATNELQTLNLNNDTLSISKSNYIKLPKNDDNDSTNEIQTLLYKNDTLSISKSNSVKIKLSNIYSDILFKTGNGMDGNFISKGKDTIIGIKYYKNFYLKQGDTLFIGDAFAKVFQTVLKVSDTCKIEGVIYGVGRGFNYNQYQSANCPLTTFGGQGGSGGGTGSSCGFEKTFGNGFKLSIPEVVLGVDGNSYNNHQIDQLLMEIQDFQFLSGGLGGIVEIPRKQTPQFLTIQTPLF